MVLSLFGSPRKVTPLEFKKAVRSKLLSRGLSHRDIDYVADIADGSLFEPGRYRGIDRQEKERIIKTLRENKGRHTLSEHQIEIVEQVLEEEL